MLSIVIISAVEMQNDLPRYLVDEMLGKTLRWLRILGFDALWAKDMRQTYEEDIDNRIILTALNENRILVTRDKTLALRAIKYGVNVILVPNNLDDITKMLIYVLSNSGMKLQLILDTLRKIPARCPICNGSLIKIKKEDVKNRVPPRVFLFNNEFWICKNCGKIFWRGSHWRRIEKVIHEVSCKLETLKKKTPNG